jgi:hypothetical protein
MTPFLFPVVALVALPGWLAARPVRIAFITLIFIAVALAMLVLSGLVMHGWWQAFFLESGVGTLIAGIVDVAVLSALHDLVEGGGDRKLSVRIDELRRLLDNGEHPTNSPGDGPGNEDTREVP